MWVGKETAFFGFSLTATTLNTVWILRSILFDLKEEDEVSQF